MILLDTNAFIYLAKGMLPADRIAKTDIAHASITKIEVLGYSALPANELLLLTALFEGSHNLELTDSIVDRAVRLRQAKPMSLGDAIIAATALEHGLKLWTANLEDFKQVEGLETINPLATL